MQANHLRRHTPRSSCVPAFAFNRLPLLDTNEMWVAEVDEVGVGWRGFHPLNGVKLRWASHFYVRKSDKSKGYGSSEW